MYCPRYFFCIYFDELLKRIERTGIGCHIGHHFYGGLRYADDVVLLNPTVCGLQLLIIICENSLLSTMLHLTQERLCVLTSGHGIS